jgi:hypothetical protein
MRAAKVVAEKGRPNRQRPVIQSPQDAFLPAAILETVIVSPFTAPVNLTLSPAYCSSAAKSWLAML